MASTAQLEQTPDQTKTKIRPSRPDKDKLLEARPQNHTPTTKILDLVRAAEGVVHMAQMTITPAMAKDLLLLNYANRPIKLSDLSKHINNLKNGKWIYDANAVKILAKRKFTWYETIDEIDEKGKVVKKSYPRQADDFELFDGQKRLLACLYTGIDIVIDIVIGLSRGAKNTVDTNANRTLSDTARMMGFKDWNNLSAAIRNIFYYEKFQRLPSNIDKGETMDNGQLVEWLENKKRTALLIDLLKASERFYDLQGFLSKSEWATVYYLLQRHDAVFAKYFIEKLAEGADLDTQGKKTDANIHRLRTFLFRFDRETKNKKDGKFKLRTPRKMSRFDYKLRHIIRAFNASRDKQRLDDRFKVDLEDRKIEKLH